MNPSSQIVPVAAAPGVGIAKREDEVDVVAAVDAVLSGRVEVVAVIIFRVARLCQWMHTPLPTAYLLLPVSEARVVVLAVDAVLRRPLPAVHGQRRGLDARVAGCVALEATVALPGAATHIIRMQWCADAAPRYAAVAARAHNSGAAAAPIVAVAHVRNIARAAGGGVNLRGAERGATSTPQRVIPIRIA